MQIYQEAVCDKHQEFCLLMIDSPMRTILTQEDNQIIKEWLIEHSACTVRIVSLDEDMDFLFENNYRRVLSKSS